MIIILNQRAHPIFVLALVSKTNKGHIAETMVLPLGSLYTFLRSYNDQGQIAENKSLYSLPTAYLLSLEMI